MLFFISVVFLILFFANFVLYLALVDIFGLTAPVQLVALGTILGVLSASFIAATILGMRYYNLFTRVYYLVAAVWMGLFVYLFLFSVLYELLVWVIGGSLAGLGKIFIAIAFLVSAYGLIHAKKIYIKEMEVGLPNIPEKWRGRRAVWISDLHLGQIHGSLFVDGIVKKVNGLPHDIVFIGGDLYDGTGVSDISELAASLKYFSAPLGIYFVMGNHEEFGSDQKFIDAIRSAKINLLIDKMVEIDGLQIIGIDNKTGSSREVFQKVISGLSIRPDVPSILLKHEPKYLDIADKAGVSMQISGHTHNGQLWPLGYIAELTYKGFAYGLRKFKKIKVYVSSGVGTWGPPMRVGTNCEIVIFKFV